MIDRRDDLGEAGRTVARTPRQRAGGHPLDLVQDDGAPALRGRLWHDGHSRWLLSSLEPSRSCVPEIREQVRLVLATWQVRPWDDEPVLLMNELTTNAVEHARTMFSVGLAWDGTALRGSVTDANPTVPVPVVPEPDAVGGRGLWVVEQLSSFWGVDAERYGKTVWFELSGPVRKAPRWAGASRWSSVE
jgi:hypothetical protein